jgi:CRP-like cAMP-binding protein
MATYPEIAQKLTNLQIAAYLGITPEFISKIRRKIASQK